MSPALTVQQRPCTQPSIEWRHFLSSDAGGWILTMVSLRALGVSLALVAAVPAQAKEFRAADIYPADYPTVQAVVQMDKLMRERSAGQHGITVLGHHDRDTEIDTVVHVRDGTLDMARVNIAVLDKSPPTIVASLPYLFKSTAQMRRVLDGPIGEEILASLEGQGLVGLCFYDAGPRSFYSVKRPIKSAADIKGMKVRVQQTDAWRAAMRALGAEPVAMPFEGVSPSLESGMIEAADNNWPSYVASKQYNIAKYFSPTEHSMAPAVLIFSKRVWDGLSRDEQALIRGAARESVSHMRRLWDDYEATSRKTVETAGGEIVTDVDRKSFADALVPLYPTMIADPKLRDTVRRIQSEE
jgi:tripartite ATP-independent transporter DctP family solute receptor